jgi:predicted amidophosphoribosyltransferase
MFEPDVCLYCGKQLSIWENTRHYCWNCHELTSEGFHEEDEDLIFTVSF